MNARTSLLLPHFLQKRPPLLLFLGLVGLSILGYYWLGYQTLRSNFGQLITLFCGLFLCYGLAIAFRWSRPYVVAWIGTAVIFRLLLLFTIPSLSDDYARFVWDGRLLANGYNPFLYLPIDVLNTPIAQQAGLSPSLFSLLNSPHYFTVYPPLNQAFFGLAAWLSGSDLWLNVVWLRVFIVLSEMGTFWLLYSPKNPRRLLIYALNPLIIIELTGNLHFEAVLIFFLLLAFRWLKTRWFWSAMALVLAITTKLLPLLFLPLLVFRLGWRKGFQYAVVVGLGVLALFSPFLSLELLQNIAKSLDLYFQKFEFNASLYYLLRTVGFWVKGYNIIQILGPTLSFLSASGIVALAWLKRNEQLETMALWSLLLYFLCATTIHPWYITTLVALCSFTSFRFPLVWSALLPLTYAAYSTTIVQENNWLLGLEYSLVLGWFLWELGIFKKKNPLAPTPDTPNARASP